MKARKRKLTDDEILDLYLVGLKTMEEIGTLAGVSKQMVRLVLNANGVEYRGGKIEKKCLFCGGAFQAVRKSVKQGKSNYCSIRCFNASRSMGRDMSVPSRLGRAALAEAGYILPLGAVVHHIDGDRRNNSLDNLQIFKTQHEHMQYHHSLGKHKRGAEACGGPEGDG